MKKIKYSSIKNFSKIGHISHVEEIPVFERENEFADYVFASDNIDKKKIINDLFETASEEEKWYYGEEVVMDKCKKQASREINEQVNELRRNMLAEAKEHKGEYFAVLHSQYLGHGDYLTVNDGIYASEEVAKVCADILNEQYNRQHTVVDNEGNATEDEKEL